MPDEPKKSQAEKFADLARQLEADEDEAAFGETLRKVVKAPLADQPKPTDPSKL